MDKELIIVESPTKVKTIKKFLGNRFIVEASMGHVRDLPRNSLGVDEKDNFKPKYVIIPGKEKIIKRLKEAAQKASRVYLAPDPDREGEAIAWHIAELIKDKNQNYKRIQFNEITKNAVLQALKEPRNLDENLFNSQQARRILDRLVGYKISPILWEKVKRGTSAGRVQSVALRLIVEREREREKFVPEEYWLLWAILKPKEDSQESQEYVKAELWQINGRKAKIKTEQDAEKVIDSVTDKKFIIEEVQSKERTKVPPPPFITSTLQAEANIKFNFTTQRTMRIAQQLYEGIDLGEAGTTALITYMRTDSVRVSKEAQTKAKKWIVTNLGKEFYPPKTRNYKNKSKAQDAHEAIRPVDVFIEPDSIKQYLSSEQYKLYKIIWRRFVASQMASAKILTTTIKIKAGNTIWLLKGERIVFPGFLKIYPQEEEKYQDVPVLEKGDVLKLKEIKKEQRFTQPPPRYTEASLVKKLEEKGIGRPSTYAQIITTLKDRKYIRSEKRQLVPTELGRVVNDLLVNHFQDLINVDFTAKMEENLDLIAEGKVKWTELLNSFSKEFYPVLQKAKKEMSNVKNKGIESSIKCEVCGSPMVIRFGKNGEFLACSNYPKCKNTKDFVRTKQGDIEIVDRKEEVDKACPSCGAPLIVKRNRSGLRFLACSNFPKCKHTEPFFIGVPCPKDGCDGEVVEKISKNKKIFYGCNKYPNCDFVSWDMPVNNPCPKCNHPYLLLKRSKKLGEYLKCPNCTYQKKKN